MWKPFIRPQTWGDHTRMVGHDAGPLPVIRPRTWGDPIAVTGQDLPNFLSSAPKHEATTPTSGRIARIIGFHPPPNVGRLHLIFDNPLS